MEKIKEVTKKIRVCVDDKVDSIKEICRNHKKEIVVGALATGMCVVSGGVIKQYLNDSKKIEKLMEEAASMTKENKRLLAQKQDIEDVLNVAMLENIRLMERMEQKDESFKRVASDGMRHGSSEAARQMGYLSQATRQMKAQA